MGVKHNMYVFKWQVIDYWIVWMDCVTDEEWLFYISILELGKRIFWKMCFTRHSLDQSSRNLWDSSILFIYLSSNIHSIGQPSGEGQQCMLKTNQNHQHFTSQFWNDKLCSQDAGQTWNTWFHSPHSIHPCVQGLGVLGLSLNALSQGHHQMAEGLSCVPSWVLWGWFYPAWGSPGLFSQTQLLPGWAASTWDRHMIQLHLHPLSINNCHIRMEGRCTGS